MKCEYCGTEYEEYTLYACHKENKDCPLSDTNILQSLIEQINDVIKKVRFNPTEWKFRLAKFEDGNLVTEDLKIADIGHSDKIIQFDFHVKKEYYCTVWCPDCCGQDFQGCFDGHSEKHGPFDTFIEADTVGKQKCSSTIYEYKITEE